MPFLRTVLFSSLTVTLVATAAAQIVPPVITRNAPVALSPSSGFYDYQYGSPNLSFVWTQGPYFAFRGQLPTHFLFCLKRIRDPDCSHATAVANLLPTQIPRTTVYSPLLQPIGTRYTYTPTIPDSRLDYIVAWQVLGCTSNADSSCMSTVHTWMVPSTVKLDGINVSGNVSGNDYTVTAQGTNLGSRNLSAYPHPVDNTIWVRTAVLDAGQTGCLTNPNDPSVASDTSLYVMDGYGRLTQFANLPRNGNQYVVSGVVAIIRLGSFYDETELPSVDIDPGQTRELSISVTATFRPEDRPVALASGIRMDSGNMLQEADDLDNDHAECEVFFR